MKQVLCYLILIFTLLSCSKNVVAKNSTERMEENLWEPISLKNWNQTPAMNNRKANEEDVKRGTAVFYIEGDFDDYMPYKVQLPKLAYLTDYDTKEKELVVIIQIEETPNGIVVGYRNLYGGNGAGLLSEFDILNEKQVEELQK